MIPEPGALVGVLVVGAVYLRGVRAVWMRAGHGRGVRAWQAAACGAGLLAVLLALETPLDGLSEALFAAHMVQHLVLILVAAPLLALGSPRVGLTWGLPHDLRRGAARLWPAWLGRPAVAFALHVVAVWAWHVPSLYEAALASRWVHAAEHASFLGTGVLFWWALLHARHGHAAYGVGVLYVFGLALQSTILGALLAFARAPWYTSHLATTSAWGLTPLEDQQLAGLIMWVPGGLVYLAAALTLFGLWLTAEAGAGTGTGTGPRTGTGPETGAGTGAPAPAARTPARRSAEPSVSPEP